MNGVSVYPVQKTQNAPTWQVEKQAREEAFSGLFINFLPPHTAANLSIKNRTKKVTVSKSQTKQVRQTLDTFNTLLLITTNHVKDQ